MFATFSITFPFFALVFMGYLGTRLALLPLTAIPGLNAYVLFFALPCMLFQFGSSTPIEQLLDANVFIVYLPCALVIVASTMALTLPKGANWNNAALGALVAAFPNTGFLGMPLLITLLGLQASGPIIITIIIDMVMTSSLCVALSRLDTRHPSGFWPAFKNALHGIMSNPMPWAILLGAGFSFFNLELIGVASKTVELLAVSASPVALFTIGAVLARPAQKTAPHASLVPATVSGQIATANSSSPSALIAMQRAIKAIPDVWLIALFKLFLHPLLVLLVGGGAIQFGLPLDPFALTVIVLVAALPSASNVALLAERFQADTGRIAKIILLSTTLGFFSFTAAVTLLV